jgi:hypothetical protein
MEATGAFPLLYDYVSAFGYKLSAEDENFGCFQGHISNFNDKKGIPAFGESNPSSASVFLGFRPTAHMTLFR